MRDTIHSFRSLELIWDFWDLSELQQRYILYWTNFGGALKNCGTSHTPETELILEIHFDLYLYSHRYWRNDSVHMYSFFFSCKSFESKMTTAFTVRRELDMEHGQKHHITCYQWKQEQSKDSSFIIYRCHWMELSQGVCRPQSCMKSQQIYNWTFTFKMFQILWIQQWTTDFLKFFCFVISFILAMNLTSQ